MPFCNASSLRNSQLALLLNAYEAFREASPEEAEALGDKYELGLGELFGQSPALHFSRFNKYAASASNGCARPRKTFNDENACSVSRLAI